MRATCIYPLPGPEASAADQQPLNASTRNSITGSNEKPAGNTTCKWANLQLEP